MEKISSENIQFIKNSWIDPVGKVFLYKGRIFRGIYSESEEIIKTFFESGLITELVESNLFPETTITNFESDEFALIVEHKKIHPITYPFEWSFSMLKDAALAIVKTNKIARKYGYQLKDCHGYNILFDNLNPNFIDLGSFIPCNKEFEDWIAYEEFIKYYLLPLKLWSKGDSYFARNSISLQLKVIPYSSYYKNGLFRIIKRSTIDKIFMLRNVYRLIYSLDLSRYDGRIDNWKLNLINNLRRRRLIPVAKTRMDSLLRKVDKIKRPNYKSQWKGYHNVFFDGVRKSSRFDRLINLIGEYSDITSIIDIAANQGYFSHLVLNNTQVEKVISLDYDENAVDFMYEFFKTQEKKPEAIVLQDFMSPIMHNKFLQSADRYKCDAAFALALTHHIFLTQNNLPGSFFKILAQNCNKYAFIEFMPLGLYDGKKFPKFPDWYTQEWFATNFEEFFTILKVEKLEKNRILFIGKKK